MMRTIKRGETEQIRIRTEQYNRLVELADRNGRTLIMQLTMLLDKALVEEDRPVVDQPVKRRE